MAVPLYRIPDDFDGFFLTYANNRFHENPENIRKIFVEMLPTKDDIAEVEGSSVLAGASVNRTRYIVNKTVFFQNLETRRLPLTIITN